MSAAAAAPPALDPSPGRDLARWGLAAAVVLALHAVLVAAALRSLPLRGEPSEALPAVLIDMAPPASGPSRPSAPSPAAEPAPPLSLPDPVLEATPEIPEAAVLAPPAELARPAETLPEPRPPEPAQIEASPPPPIPATVAIPPPPAPHPEPARAQPVPATAARPKPALAKPVAVRPVEAPRAKPASAPRGERVEARRVAASGGANTAAAAAQSSGTSAASRASWQGALVAHLRRFLRPQGAQTGAASVRFSIDRGGRVLSASLVASAGAPDLDGEALAVFRRAQPLPAAPADVPGASFTFTIPIRFSSR
ncbi:MAG: TonB family protein [Methylobacteriaceae bacterium]|nr:TonB family protein [Methylobacteriaceae bacterium]